MERQLLTTETPCIITAHTPPLTLPSPISNLALPFTPSRSHPLSLSFSLHVIYSSSYAYPLSLSSPFNSLPPSVTFPLPLSPLGPDDIVKSIPTVGTFTLPSAHTMLEAITPRMAGERINSERCVRVALYGARVAYCCTVSLPYIPPFCLVLYERG